MVAEPIIHALCEKIKYEYPDRRHAKASYCIVPVNAKQFVAVRAGERTPHFDIFSKKLIITEGTIHERIIPDPWRVIIAR
jgi:hypothetical protein